jgi:ParB-like chromosome segregation protein Spo0J
MAERRLDLETSLVAPELRGRLFRVDPRRLVSKLPASKHCDRTLVARLVEGLIAIGVMTPVLLDGDGNVIAGHGLVAAAIQLDLDDIPAIDHDGLSLSERKAFAKSMARFFNDAGLDAQALRAEVRQAMVLTALLETAAEDAVCTPDMALT